MKYFVDITKADGSEAGGNIAFPESEATAYAREIRAEHPDWHVELLPLQGTP